MNNYDIILRTLKHEGGYSNDPRDKGGETYCGISRVANPTWSGWFLLDKIQDKKLAYSKGFLYNEVVSFYNDKYFNTQKGMGLSRILNSDVRACIFDFCVNSGGAIKQIQYLLNRKYQANLTLDGLLGNKTISIINNIKNQTQLNNDIVESRKQYLETLAENDSKFKVFINGLIKRANSYFINYTEQKMGLIANIVDFIQKLVVQLFKN
jgi:lysozyme family protein